jgi:hypothetical protein
MPTTQPPRGNSWYREEEPLGPIRERKHYSAQHLRHPALPCACEARWMAPYWLQSKDSPTAPRGSSRTIAGSPLDLRGHGSNGQCTLCVFWTVGVSHLSVWRINAANRCPWRIPLAPPARPRTGEMRRGFNPRLGHTRTIQRCPIAPVTKGSGFTILVVVERQVVTVPHDLTDWRNDHNDVQRNS